MGRYFFHLTGKFSVNDTEGEEFPTPEAAIAAAQESVGDLAMNRLESEPRGRVLRVTDETGAEIASFTISDSTRS
jgi:hypothetical protein